jgi:O-antigen/teichoic acid export membrane protein
MTVTKRIAFGAAASWFSRVVAILLGLLLLPVLFRKLGREELGVWLLLGQSWAVLGVFDLGFTPTLTRRIALAKGKSGTDPNAPLTEESIREIADLVAGGQRIFGWMAVGVFVFSWVAGLLYVRGLELHNLSHTTVLIAWTVLCACQAVNVASAVWACLLQGVGNVGWDALIVSLISATTLTAQIVAVLFGGGLVSLAVIATFGAVGQRGLSRWFARRSRPELFARRGQWNLAVLRGMPKLAFHAWLTSVGMLMLFYTDPFFIAAAKGAEGIPAFRAAYVFVHNLTVLAVAVGLASSVFITHYWQAGDLAQVRRLVERNCRLGLLVMLCGCAFVITAGQSLFNLWLGPGNFTGHTILAVFLIYETLEAHSYIISTCSRATEDEAFGYSTLLAGALKLVLAGLLMRTHGLLGLAVATMVALLLTNHWFMVWRGLRRLQLPFREYTREVIAPALLWAGGALALAVVCARVLEPATDLMKLVAAVIPVGLVFLLALFRLVMTTQERASVRQKCSALATSLLPAR